MGRFGSHPSRGFDTGAVHVELRRDLANVSGSSMPIKSRITFSSIRAGPDPARPATSMIGFGRDFRGTPGDGVRCPRPATAICTVPTGFQGSATGTRNAGNATPIVCPPFRATTYCKPPSDFFTDGALHIKQQGRNSCKIDFRLIAVCHHARHEVFRAARYGRQPGRQQAAGAGLGHGNRRPFQRKLSPDNFFQRLFGSGVDEFGERRFNFFPSS